MTTFQSRQVLNARVSLGLLLASLFYFVDIFWRSARKPFWFDELFTVYLVRLPTFHETWTAVQHGADFNPPLFYLLTRMSQAAFGDGNIALRLPETVGVWIFCLCLFAFVARRLGALAGCIAGFFPFLTIAQYYAYEARPHGITVGWCGLALVCWQRIVEGNAKLGWHVAFTLVMLGSVLTHVYAVYLFVPFALTEALSLVRDKKVHPGILVGLALPTVIAVPLFAPMMRTFKQIMPAVGLQTGGVGATLLQFTAELLGASVFPILLFVVIAAFVLSRRSRLAHAVEEGADTPEGRRELVLAFCFLCIPLLGIAGARANHAFFYNRYFLSSIAGISILFAHAVSRISASMLPGRLVAGFMCFMFLADGTGLAFTSLRHKLEGITEPSSRQVLYPDPGIALNHDAGVFDRHPDVPILDVNALDYIFMYHYAPPAVATRLYYPSPAPTDFFYVSYQRLAEWAHVPLHAIQISPFLEQNNHLYVYCSANTPVIGCTEVSRLLLKANYALVTQSISGDGAISEYLKR